MKNVNLNNLGVQAMNLLEMEELNGGNMSIGQVAATFGCIWFTMATASLTAVVAATGGIIYGAYRLVKYTVNSAAPNRA